MGYMLRESEQVASKAVLKTYSERAEMIPASRSQNPVTQHGLRGGIHKSRMHRLWSDSSSCSLRIRPRPEKRFSGGKRIERYAHEMDDYRQLANRNLTVD
ncbi:uncharacterized protein BJ212DRAFT_157562 [Suillus subaureus]|uniref:Uncharacterized protein n=1 Tax=Suillus subaureus TaxID=48587 RepID=A0A9P7ECE9_9AGAM|nr:uncharacterized protein BJ212DRAFT_157562 [Suillus subaureus]KAG1817214.1 hypothetical protein BJ212DRAFT_157562 [Suillus subaureus]